MIVALGHRGRCLSLLRTETLVEFAALFAAILEVTQQVAVAEMVVRCRPVAHPINALGVETLRVEHLHETLFPSTVDGRTFVFRITLLLRHVDVELGGNVEKRRNAVCSLQGTLTLLGRTANVLADPVVQGDVERRNLRLLLMMTVEQGTEFTIFAVFVEQVGHLASEKDFVDDAQVAKFLVHMLFGRAGSGEIQQVVVPENVFLYCLVADFIHRERVVYHCKVVGGSTF